jgi:hemerythrin-like domain-containing protein
VSTITDEPFDGREMFMVHAIFRRELGLAPALVRGVAPGDRERAAVVAEHIQGVNTVLHHHHASEDEYVWPLLLERGVDQVAPLVVAMESQHEEVAKRGFEVGEALAAFSRTASVESQDALAGALDRLVPLLNEHLTVEEQEVVPLMEQHITMADSRRVSRSYTPCDTFRQGMRHTVCRNVRHGGG